MSVMKLLRLWDGETAAITPLRPKLCAGSLSSILFHLVSGRSTDSRD